MSVGDAMQAVVMIGSPILGFELVRGRPGHTRAHLVLGAAVGGGLAGAVLAIVASTTGASFENVFPVAVFSLGFGAFIGLVGLAAFSLGRWLSRLP
jgi:hypothetical protein